MILVVIPALNEEKKIGRVLRDLFEHGYQDLLVVDDGSNDETAEVAKKAGAKVIRHCLNRGQGAALETGDEFARRIGAETVIHFDADGQFSAADIDFALRKMRENQLDVVLGSRFLDGRSKIPFLKKYLILPCARVINRVFSGLALTDVHNGFRIFNRKALAEITMSQDGMAHNSEIVARIRECGLKFCEVPVEVRYDEFGQGIKGGLGILKDLFFSKLIK